MSDALSGMSESLDVLVGPLHPLPALTRPLFLLVANMEEFLVFAENIGVTPVPVIMSLSAPRRALLVTLVSLLNIF